MSLRAVRVRRVGVRPRVDGGPGGGEVLPPPPLGQEAEDGDDDHQDEDEAGDGDGDREVALGEADAAGVVRARGLEEIKHFKNGYSLESIDQRSKRGLNQVANPSICAPTFFL